MTAADICVSDHGDNYRRALPTLRLCPGCRKALGRHLADLPHLHNRLGDHLPTSGGGGQRVSGSSSAPLPINGHVADLRHQIRHDLVWWCKYVAQARGMELPADRLPEVAGWLGRHADWLAADPVAAEECPPVMRELVGKAWAVLDPDGSKRIRIGPCTEQVELSPSIDAPCGGTLYATVRADGDDRPSVIYCDGPCGAERAAAEWRRFGREYLRERMAG